VELTEICELIVDCEHKTAPTQATGYPSIRTPNIGRGYFILEGVNRVSEETYRLWTRRAVPQSGDLIMAREAPVGNVAMVPQGLQPCLGQRTLLIRPDRSKVEPAFLNYLLNGPHIQGLLHSKASGATVAHLNMKDVRSLHLPELPPLPAQRRIADTLSAYDELIENSQRRITILEAMARALYREWFIWAPDAGNWPRRTLGDFLTLKRGYDLPDRLRRPGQVPVVSSSGVTGQHDESRAVGPGLVTGRYGTLGDVHLIWEDYWPLNTSLYVVDLRGTPFFYAYWLLRDVLREQSGSAAAVPGLNRNHLHQITVPAPPRGHPDSIPLLGRTHGHACQSIAAPNR
jgi:type I restriction enzyme S subunit